MRSPSSSRAITGHHHPLAKRIRAMIRHGELRDNGEILLETPKLIEDAVESGVAIRAVLIRADAAPPVRGLARRLLPESECYEVAAKLFPALTATEHNPGILALAQAPQWSEADLFGAGFPLLLILAGIQDPGNLGTILRTAEAFGASGVLTLKGTVSAFNAKAVRAAAGTLFRLPLLERWNTAQVLRLLRERNVALLASVARGGIPLSTIPVRRPLAVALGSEGGGLPRELEQAGTRISIPMARPVESLNVATAAAVMLYEIARQRQGAESGGKG